jgi:hypothetical protein
MFIKNSAQKQLLKLEKDKFLKSNWPKIVKKANQLDIDLSELIKKS